jgi:hypothetical protein
MDCYITELEGLGPGVLVSAFCRAMVLGCSYILATSLVYAFSTHLCEVQALLAAGRRWSGQGADQDGCQASQLLGTQGWVLARRTGSMASREEEGHTRQKEWPEQRSGGGIGAK